VAASAVLALSPPSLPPGPSVVVPSPWLASPPVAASHDSDGHDQMPFTQVQLVCSPPSTIVPSQAGLGAFCSV
jgi:hypothetical protein